MDIAQNIEDDAAFSADLAAPYGTRSRNRTGSSRPNYAEDKDIDNDLFEFYDGKKGGELKKSSRQAGASVNADASRAGTTTRKAGAEDGKSVPHQNGSKDHTQSAPASNDASTANSTPGAAVPSKKRKAATQQSQPIGAVGGTSSSGPQRKTASSAQNSSSAMSSWTWPESNVLTFDNSKARPQNGKMVADDGTILAANGESYYIRFTLSSFHHRGAPAHPHLTPTPYSDQRNIQTDPKKKKKTAHAIFKAKVEG